jgi:hypothetical protein
MSDFDMSLLSQMHPTWLERNLLAGTVFDPDELVHVIDAILRCGASAAIPSVTITPRQSAKAVAVIDRQITRTRTSQP